MEIRESGAQTKYSKLSFIDLAGSENFDKAHGQNVDRPGQQTRIKEMTDINKSLLALNTIFKCLAEDTGKGN